jgi:hypothetical protein
MPPGVSPNLLVGSISLQCILWSLCAALSKTKWRAE